MIRSTIFWIHLVCGVAAGLVVLMMSVTGVLLTYERQMLAWTDRAHYADAPPGAERHSLATLLDAVKAHDPAFAVTAITVRSDARAPVTFAAGRDGTLVANPYTGVVAKPGGEGLRKFFAAVTGWHRWFNASNENRSVARAITGASNLAFLFLVLSGIYLWLPRIYKWAAFKTRLFFNPKAGSGKARDFNWHHVLGIWSAIPLAVVVGWAVVFSYPWANNLVYRSVGEEPPVRGAPRGGPGGAGAPAAAAAAQREAGGGAASRAGGDARTEGARRGDASIPAGGSDWGATSLSYDELFARAAAQAGEWRAITLNLPAGGDASIVRFGIDQGNGGQPQLRHTLTLDAATGATQAWQPFSSQSTGQKARSWIRFLHTGEALGIAGQTIAGAVSFTSVLKVWTGLALAYRRLISPLFARRGSATRNAGAA
jgi:uncharacterized iron-regulated membrane protein